jgi:hypothetical protein
MAIHENVWDGPGYHLGARLNPAELQIIRTMVNEVYLERLRAVDPALADAAAPLGIENYHLLQHKHDHGTMWPKQARIWPVERLPAIMQMGFFRDIVAEFGDVITSDTEQIWRLVRPNADDDVGPIHADGWFWDYGNGVPPTGYDRFKIWMGLYTEPGRNGLCVVPDSHKREWKHHSETRHGISKPVLDERMEDLDVRLLPLGAGEMVMFHDRLLHGGVVNRGSRCRVSFELTIFFRTNFATLPRTGPTPLRRSA